MNLNSQVKVKEWGPVGVSRDLQVTNIEFECFNITLFTPLSSAMNTNGFKITMAKVKRKENGIFHTLQKVLSKEGLTALKSKNLAHTLEA